MKIESFQNSEDRIEVRKMVDGILVNVRRGNEVKENNKEGEWKEEWRVNGRGAGEMVEGRNLSIEGREGGKGKMK